MFKKQLFTAIASAALLLCASQANAMVVVYTVTLNGANESPPIVSSGLGLGIVTIDDVLNTMRVQASFSGLTGNTTVAHIHCCTAVAGAANSGVASMTPTFADFPAGVTAGAYDMTFNMTLPGSFNVNFITANGGTPATAFAALNTGLLAGKGYLNIHTTQFRSGEIRGFLAPNVPVPEPGTYAMLLGGLGLVGFMARRRRQA